ncbi:hypothetical protein MBLNU457_6919t1 [Dothideomycetes sp. NU457]
MEVAQRVRSIYRRILRELPLQPGTPTILSSPSPLQKQIRSSIVEASPDKSISAQLDEMDQFVQYIKAQRMYTTLIERYNPGMNMTEEEKQRLTARRVGMEMPVEYGGRKE